MTWSYSGNPAASDVDAIHYEVGDTDPAHQLLQDEEIAYLLQSNSLLFAAAAAADSLVQRFRGRLGKRTVGKLEIDNTILVAAWKELAERLRQRAQRQAVGMSVGGQSISQLFDDALNNQDAVQPAFRRTSEEFPGTVNPLPPSRLIW